MTNTDLLEHTLAQIEAHPETWDQSMWAKRTECGTAYRFAGHAVALTHPDARFVSYSDCVILYPDTPLEGDAPISDTAAHLLGLDPYAAEVLFDPNNDLDRLRRLVADLVAGQPIDFFDKEPELAEAVDAR